MSSTTVDQLRNLTPVLAQLAGAPAASAAKIKSLKQEFGDELTRDLLNAASLQAKAGEKLGAGVWWFTDKSLQQATPWQVARVKANWFSAQAVYDLCCGIGGDTLQLARLGPVAGVELDERLVVMAAANMSRAANAAVVHADAVEYSRPPSAAIHIDPDRRSEGRRASRPDAYSPPWSEVEKLICGAAGSLVKLAPAARPELSNLPESHCTWISLSGSVREQSLLSGVVRESFLSRYGVRSDFGRSALIVDRQCRETVFTPAAEPSVVAQTCDQPGELMIDPDAAIRAAGLTDAFAVQHGFSTLGGPAGFLSGATDKAPPRELAIAEPTLWCGSSDDRRLRRELRSRNAHPIRIKTRGVAVDPIKLGKRLRDCGEKPVNLWIGRSRQRQYAVITVVSDHR